MRTLEGNEGSTRRKRRTRRCTEEDKEIVAELTTPHGTVRDDWGSEAISWRKRRGESQVHRTGGLRVIARASWQWAFDALARWHSAPQKDTACPAADTSGHPADIFGQGGQGGGYNTDTRLAGPTVLSFAARSVRGCLRHSPSCSRWRTRHTPSRPSAYSGCSPDADTHLAAPAERHFRASRTCWAPRRPCRSSCF
jgi:hypothetical protein